MIYRVEESGELHTVLEVTAPEGATSWTPSAVECPESEARYAWAVRAVGEDGAGAWSEALLFETAGSPSEDEVRRALEVLRRYTEMVDDGPDGSARDPGAVQAERQTREAFREDQVRPSLRAIRQDLNRAARTAEVKEAAAPALGDASITISEQFHLADTSALFKNDQLFLWDDTTGNTALGRLALSSATGYTSNNTAVGREALRYTERGPYSSHSRGSYNTAVGDRALRSNTEGFRNTATGNRALESNTEGTDNTASGAYALFSNTTAFANTASGARALDANTTGYRNTASGASALGSNTTGSRNTATGAAALIRNTTGDYNTASGIRAHYFNTYGSFNTASGSHALYFNTDGNMNTASGTRALLSNTTGSRNTALGIKAGYNATTGYDNIFLGSGAEGVAGESNTIRIGGATGTGVGQQDRTFIAGIRGVTTGNSDAIAVVIDSAGQLGTVSSSRQVKQDIRQVDELSRRLLELQPVAFRFKKHVARDPETPHEFGLIAEEVAEVFPELVVNDEDGQPFTVRYHLLTPLLLNEIQRQDATLREQQAELEELRAVTEEVAELRQRLAKLAKKKRG